MGSGHTGGAPRGWSGWARLQVQRWLFRDAAGALATWVSAPVGAWTGAGVVRAGGASLGARVVVVGGTSVGGAGRTAVVAWLAAAASAGGARVAVVGHGYGGRRQGVVPPGGDPDFGDDAALLAAALPGVEVVVGPRGPTARALEGRVDLVLTDGGLLDGRVRADAVLAVVDATASGAVMPAGPARVGLAAVRAAGARLWWHRHSEPGARPAPEDALARSEVVVTGVRLPDGRRVPVHWLAGRTVRPVCGIARPASFLNSLAGCGAAVIDPLIRADHHPFRLAERPAGGPVCVTTTKDWARWPAGWPVAVVETDLVVTGLTRDAETWLGVRR